jgi:diguanylate cyclase (GGDEF)-like protein
MLDLDRFKEVNDSLGHQAGDVLLQQIAQRLRDNVRASDTVARLGGDEFALVLPGAGLEGARQAAAKLLKVLQQPFEVEGQSIEARASVGLALFPPHGQDVSALLRCADVAMYAAKRSRSGLEVYTVEHDAERLRP